MEVYCLSFKVYITSLFAFKQLQMHYFRIVHTHRSVKPYKCFYCDYRSHLSGNCNLHCKQKHQGQLQISSSLMYLNFKLLRLCLSFGTLCFKWNTTWWYKLMLAATLRVNIFSVDLWCYNMKRIAVTFAGLPIKWVKVCEKYPENHNEEIHVGPSPFGKRSTPK